MIKHRLLLALFAAAALPSMHSQGQTPLELKKGDHIADLVVATSTSGEQVMPLVAAEDVGEAGFFARIWIGLSQLFG